MKMSINKSETNLFILTGHFLRNAKASKQQMTEKIEFSKLFWLHRLTLLSISTLGVVMGLTTFPSYLLLWHRQEVFF